MKTDKTLGLEIMMKLKELGIETPMKIGNYSKDDAILHIQDHFKSIMQLLNLDLTDDSLKDTPRRVAEMFIIEIFEGLCYSRFPKCTTVENKMKYDEMIIVEGINVSSTCEHHFQTIDGSCKIAYIPKDRVLGLSKFNRVVRFFSKRPQIQERLTEQIYFSLAHILQTENIAVEIKAVHHCVKSRGIEDHASVTTTRKLGGVFIEQAVRQEFLNS